MKTFNDIKKLNYNSLAFFKGISVIDAKWDLAVIIYHNNASEIPTTKNGGVKIKISDYVDKSNFDFTMKSASSSFEGVNQMEYLCKAYNKGIELGALKKYAENKAFIKALKFTGKFNIVNDILNRGQLLKLQKIWLTKNTIYLNEYKFSKKTKSFILNNAWAKDFVENVKQSNKKIS